MAIPSNNKKGAFHVARKLSNGGKDSAEHVGVHGKTNYQAIAQKKAEKQLRKRDHMRVPVGSSSRSKVNKDGYFTLQQIMGLASDGPKDKPFSTASRAADLLRGASADEAEQRKILPEYDDWVSWLSEDPEGARDAISDLFLKSDITDRNMNLDLLGVLGNLANNSYPRVEGEAPQTFAPMHDLLQYLKDYDKDTIEPKPTGSTYEIYRTLMRAQPIRDEQGNIVDWSYDGAEPVSNNIYDSDIFQFDVPEGKKIDDLLPYLTKTVREDSEEMVPFSDVLPVSELDYSDPDPIANFRIKNALGKLHDYAQVKDIRNANAYDDAVSDINYVNQFADALTGDKIYDMGLGVMRDALRKVDDTGDISKSPFGWEILNIARNHANARKAKGTPATTEQEKLEDLLLDKYQFGKAQDAQQTAKDNGLDTDWFYGAKDVSKGLRAANALMDTGDMTGFPIYNPDLWNSFGQHVDKALLSRGRALGGAEEGLDGQRKIDSRDKTNATKSMARLIRMLASGKVNNVEDAKKMAQKALDYGATVDDTLAYMKSNPNFAEDLERAKLSKDLYNTKEDVPYTDSADAYGKLSAQLHDADSDDFARQHMTNVTPIDLLRQVESGHGGAKDTTAAVIHKNPYAIGHIDNVPEAPAKLDDAIGEYINRALDDALAGVPMSQRKEEAPRVRRQLMDGIAKELNEMAPDGDIGSIAQKWLNKHEIGSNIRDFTVDNALSTEQQEAIDVALTRLPDRYAKAEMAEPDVGDVLRGRFTDDSELQSTLDEWSKWREDTLPGRLDKFMAANGYKPYQRSIAEKILRAQDRKARKYLEDQANDLNEKYIARRQRGQDLAQSMKDKRLGSIIDTMLNDNASILQYEDPHKALEALDKFTDKAGTLKRIGNEYYKLAGIDGSGNIQWTRIDKDEVNNALDKLRSGMDENELEAFNEKWEDLLDNGRLNPSDVSSYLAKEREARHLANLGKMRAKAKKTGKTLAEERSEKNQQSVNNAVSDVEDQWLNQLKEIANLYPETYGKYLSEAEGRDLAYNTFSDELAERTGLALQESKAKQDADDAEKAKRRAEAFREFEEKRRTEDARALENFRVIEQGKEKANEGKLGAEETEARANPNRVSQEMANLSYNKRVEGDEAQAEADKKAKQAEAKKQADEAKRAKEEADKQAKQAEMAEKTKQPPSAVRQQATEAINARKEAKKQEEQAKASQSNVEELADEYRKAVNALVAVGIPRERAEAMLNNQKIRDWIKAPAASMKNDAKPEEIKKEDNGIDKTVANTMENLSRGY